MSNGRRLCQEKESMEALVRALPISESLTKSRFSILECPRRGHCDPSRPCEAMKTPIVPQLLSEIQDRLFVNFGVVRRPEFLNEPKNRR